MRVSGLTDEDYTRFAAFAEREAIQEGLNFQLFPTTTIGSFLKPKGSSCETFGLVRVNCHKKNTTLSLLKPSTNGSNGKKS